MYESVSSSHDDRGDGQSNERFAYSPPLSPNYMYAPLKLRILIAVWGVVSTLIAFLIGVICERVFKIPQWAKLGVCFPNALSLPLLLLNSLRETSVIDQLLWGPDDTVVDAVRRGRTYILVLSSQFPLILDQFPDSKYNEVHPWASHASTESTCTR